MRGVFSIFIFIFASGPAMAAVCPLAGGLPMFSTDGTTVSPLDATGCAGDLAIRVSQALNDMASLPPLERGPADLDFNFIDVPPIQFVLNRAGRVVLDLDAHSSACVPGVVAYVRDSTSKTFFICPYAGNLTSLEIQSNIVHESRHLDGPGYDGSISETHPDRTSAFPHSNCKNGVFTGYDACDPTMTVGGSYGVQTEFLLKVSSTRAIPKAMRDAARVTAVTMMLDHFDKLPFPTKVGALLLSVDGVLSFYDGTSASVLRTNVPERDVVAIRNLPTFLDPVAGTVKNFLRSTEVDSPGAFSRIYRQFPAEKRAEVLDVYYGGMTACYLFVHSVYCELGNSPVTLDLPAEIEPIQFSVLNLFGGDIVMITAKNGGLYSLPLDKFTYEWSVDDLRKNSTLSGFRSLTMIPGAFNAGIWPDGTLVKFEHVDQQTPVSEFNGQRFKKIIGPFVWADRLDQL